MREFQSWGQRRRDAVYLARVRSARRTFLFLLAIALATYLVPSSTPEAEGATPDPVPPSVADPCALDVIVCEGELPNATTSAYTSHAYQTDATPCISADGTDVCLRHARGERLVANNCLPLGSRVSIDGTVYTVADRMNRRYGCDVYDLYYGYDVEAAMAYGRRAVRAVPLAD